MKCRILIFILINFLHIDLFSQVNLVYNGSFEIVASCPSSIGQINRATGWYGLNITPDYFNKCTAFQICSVPDNLLGFQPPYVSTDNAYSGIVLIPSNDSEHEVIATNLTNALVVGTTYHISFLVSPSYIITNPPGNNIVCYCNKIGVKFFTQPIPEGNNLPQLIDNFAQVSSDTMLTDTTRWYNFNESFIADSAYTFLSIGFFYTLGNMTCQCLNTLGFKAYYYIDNVCVSSDSSICLVNTDDEPLDDEEIQIFIDDEQHQISIHMKNPGNAFVEAFDAIGQLIMKRQLTSKDNYLSYENWASGVYLLRIGEKVYKLRLVGR